MADDITRRPDDEGEDSSQGWDPMSMLGGLPIGRLDPDSLGQMLDQVLQEAQGNPELGDMLRSMGVNPNDPTTKAAMKAQIGTFMRAAASPTGAKDMATDIARKTVMASSGNDVHDVDAEKSISDAVHVATMWLDEHTTFTAPQWRSAALSRAEWVEATMPQWDRLVRPISSGVTAAVTAAMRKQISELGPDAFGDGSDLPPQVRAMIPEGVDPAALLESWAPMLGQLSQQMFTAQLGQAVGTLAAEVVTGTEVGLPLTEPGLVALLPANVSELAASLELDRAQVQLYLAVREAARIRLFTAVPWLGPQLMTAVEEYARNITIDTEAIEASLSRIDPSDAEAMRTALQGNLFKPTPTPAQQAALQRLETLLALAEGWVDHVTGSATAERLPASAALAETIRRRRVGGAAQKTFAGLVGLELSPRRLRDAANLFAALASSPGAGLVEKAWAHPDVAPSAADLDDIIGYVERLSGGDSPTDAAVPESAEADFPAGLGSDLDAVLKGILDEADAARRGPTDDGPQGPDRSGDAAREGEADTSGDAGDPGQPGQPGEPGPEKR